MSGALAPSRLRSRDPDATLGYVKGPGATLAYVRGPAATSAYV